jgi:hypothetical protein
VGFGLQGTSENHVMSTLQAGVTMRDAETAFTIYQQATLALDRADIPYVVGGGLAVRAYGRTRYSKDMDIFLSNHRIGATMNVLNAVGFHTRDTDASWLYKAIKDEVLVDLIVRTTGDIRLETEAVRRGRWVQLQDRPFFVMGPEDLLLRKVFSEAEGRPDWYDALSMLQAPIPGFDWRYFVELAERHGAERVLALMLFATTAGAQDVIPDWVPQALMFHMLRHQHPHPWQSSVRRQLPPPPHPVNRIRAA